MNVRVTFIFIPIVLHKDLFCNRGKSKLGIGLFIHELLREPLTILEDTLSVNKDNTPLAVFVLKTHYPSTRIICPSPFLY